MEMDTWVLRTVSFNWAILPTGDTRPCMGTCVVITLRMLLALQSGVRDAVPHLQCLGCLPIAENDLALCHPGGKTLVQNTGPELVPRTELGGEQGEGTGAAWC